MSKKGDRAKKKDAERGETRGEALDERRHAKAARAGERAAKAVLAAAKAQKEAAPRHSGLKKELVALGRILPRYPETTPDEAEAYASLATDARRSALGGTTKASDVLRESIEVAVAIDTAFRGYAATVAPSYPPGRFRFLLDAIGALGDELSRPAAGAGRGEATTAAASLEAAAQLEKKKLLRALRSFAGQRDDEHAALEAARRAGTAAGGDPLAASIGTLAELARTWLGRSDATSKILLRSAGLTRELVDQALERARAHAKGGADVTLAGRRGGHDSPLVNLKEGAVLVEVIEADHVFDALAEDTNGVVGRLPLGKALRRVARGKSHGAAKAPPADGNGAVVNPIAPPT